MTEKSAIKDLSSKLYQNSKLINKSALLEPNRVERDGVSFVKANLSSPIRVNNEFAGYVVVDFSSTKFQQIVNAIKPYPSTIGYLISNDGLIVSHPNIDFIGDTIQKYAPYYEEQFGLSSFIKDGIPSVFRGVDNKGEKIILTVAPIQVGEYKMPWALVLSMPVKEILKEANKAQSISLLVAILGVIGISIIIYIRANSIGRAINLTTDVLQKLAIGDVENIQDLNLNRGDEIDIMVNSVNTLKSSLNDTSVFAEQIGVGQLDADYKLLSDRDKLGNSLITMQQNLKEAKVNQEKMKLDDEKNAWTSDGLAKFGDIIRSNNENIDILSYNIVKSLVDYLGVSMGALFVAETNEDETFYGVKAAVAYERKKMLNYELRSGEGMVGRCVFEKSTIYMTDMPEDYINITSGLGDANPKVLLLVPLIFEDKVFGVVELAGFEHIDSYKIAFVEKLAESIASTLASVQINQRTIQLLEQSKLQGEELSAQEEEMRQNMEELQATQEEAARREQEMLGVLQLMDKSIFKVEYDLNGSIISANDKYLQFLNVERTQLLEFSRSDEYKLLGANNSEINANWAKITTGISCVEKVEVLVNGMKNKLEQHYLPLMANEGSQPIKIIKVSYIVD